MGKNGRQFGFVHALGTASARCDRPHILKMALALPFSAFLLCGEMVSTNAVTAFLDGNNSRFQIVSPCWYIVLPAGTKCMICPIFLTFGSPFLRCRKNTYINELCYFHTDENLLKSHFFRTSKKISADYQRIKGWKGKFFLLFLSQDPPTALRNVLQTRFHLKRYMQGDFTDVRWWCWRAWAHPTRSIGFAHARQYHCYVHDKISAEFNSAGILYSGDVDGRWCGGKGA